MKYYAGIDAGSTYVKVAIIKSGILLGCKAAFTGIDCRKTAILLYDALLGELGISKSDVVSIISTGYGRRLVDISDDVVTEIRAHGAGAILTAPEEAKIGTIVDIGGQDSKVIILDRDGEIKNFVMNDKCAAGTGRFIEVLAHTLETTIDEIGSLSLQSKNPCQINSLCVVFAQSEVISLLARGKDRADIIAGIHISLAKRICVMVRRAGLEPEVLLTGGGALNSGIISAFEDELMEQLGLLSLPKKFAGRKFALARNELLQFIIPYFAALFIGISAGISYCSAACAPFISCYIMGSVEGVSQGFKSFIVFTIGKIFMCGILGLIIGYIGTAFLDGGRSLRYASVLYSIVMISTGLLMFMRPVSENCKRFREKTKVISFVSRHLAFNSTVHLFTMGMAFAIIPCPPMVAILTNSLRMQSVIFSIILMLLFGIGTIVSPLVIISVLAGFFSKKLKAEAPQYRMLFQKLSGVILIFLGVFSVQ